MKKLQNAIFVKKLHSIFFSKTRNESGQHYGYDFGKFDFLEMFITASVVVSKNKAKNKTF